MLVRFPPVTRIFLKRYLKINWTGDGIKGGSDADYLVKKKHIYENILIEARGNVQNV